MKLVSIEIENYRSIHKRQAINLDQPLTVIIGPNNEGKSNLLRSVAAAMQTIGFFRYERFEASKDNKLLKFRVPASVYEWENDFPRQLQSKNPEGETCFLLEFNLNDEERKKFRTKCGSANNGTLPVEIRLGKGRGNFKVKKPGRGAGSYGEKTPKIARFISEHFEFQYIPAIRTEKLSLEVIENLLEREMSTLKANDDYIESFG